MKSVKNTIRMLWVEPVLSVKNYLCDLTSTNAIILIVIIGFLVYGNSLVNGFVGDDYSQLVMNPLVHSLSYIPQLFTGSTFYSGTNQLTGQYYRPLMSSIYSFIYVLFGANAFAFHFFQLIIHITNAILVFLIFRYFFKIGLSFILSLLFLVHPMNSETVSYIAALDDILFFLFGSLALYFQLSLKENFKKRISVYLLLLLSLFSKESGVLFIVVILCYALLFSKKELIKTIAFSACTILVYGIFHLFIDQAVYSQKLLSSPITVLSLNTRLINVPVVILYYLTKAFFPIHLAISQQWYITSLNSMFQLAIIIDVLIMVIMYIFGITIYKKYKKYFNNYLFFTFWFCIGLLFYSQLFFALDFTVSDNWFYFPLVGLLGIIGVIIQIYFPKNKTFSRKIIYSLCAIAICTLSILTIMRNANFHDDFTLYSHDVKYAPSSRALVYALGYRYLYQKQFELAEPYLLKATQLDPDESINWYTLATLYEQTGQTEKAQHAYQTAIKVSDYNVAYENYAFFLYLHNDLNLASQVTNLGLQKFPTDSKLWMVKSFIEYKQGVNDEALSSAKYALGYSPSNLTETIYLLISRHLHFKVETAWTSQGRIVGVMQT